MPDHEPTQILHDHKWRAPLERAAPWAISVCVHAALIILGFTVVWTVTAPPKEERPLVIASFDDPGPAAMARESPAEDGQTEQSRPTTIPDLARTPAPASLSELLAALQPAPTTSASPEPARDDREASLARRLPDVRFAGVGASNARSVVYVVDASGSTISTFPIILRELRRSVTKLAPTQQFQVIFFGPGGYSAARHPADGPTEIKTIRLIRATRENLDAVMNWATNIMPRERSNPIPALEIALGLRPDAVFVLSTAITGLGVWEPDKSALLAQLDLLNPLDERAQRRPVVIKTVQLLEDDPGGILRAIGEAHGGKDGYKFLSRREVLAE